MQGQGRDQVYCVRLDNKQPLYCNVRQKIYYLRRSLDKIHLKISLSGQHSEQNLQQANKIIN